MYAIVPGCNACSHDCIRLDPSGVFAGVCNSIRSFLICSNSTNFNVAIFIPLNRSISLLVWYIGV